MPELITSVRNFIVKKGMPNPPVKMLVALSGGPDSVALLHLLKEIGYDLEAAHCNFGLREEAGEEAKFCKELCKNLGIPFHLNVFKTEASSKRTGESIQQTARRLRYAWFEALMKDKKIAFCATGHHADDQSETLLASLLKGDEAKLLKGIPAIRGPYIRPLLEITKAELVNYLEAQKQNWKLDKSNLTEKYARNVIRNSVIPVLERVNPNFKNRLNRKAQRFDAQYAFLTYAFEKLIAEVVTMEGSTIQLDRSAFCKHYPESFFEVFLEWWLHRKSFLGKETEMILGLAASRTGSIVQTKQCKVYRDRERWVFVYPEAGQNKAQTSFVLEADFEDETTLYIGVWKLQLRRTQKPAQFKQEANQIRYWLDLGQIQFPISIRPWLQGDRMQPRGMKGSKLVSDIMIDEKWPLHEKEKGLVFDNGGKLSLLVPFREANWAAISSRTKTCLELTVSQSV